MSLLANGGTPLVGMYDDDQDRDSTAVVTSRQSGSITYNRDIPDLPELPPSFAYGSPARGAWSAVTEEEIISRGDVLRMKYKLKIPFLENWQSGALLSKLQQDPRFRIRYFGLNEEISTLTVEAEVVGVFKNNPVPVVAALVAGAVLAVAVGVGVWLSTASIEKLGVLDFSELGEGKINLIPVLVGGVLLIFLTPLLKGR